VGGNEILRDLGGDGAVALVVAANQPQRVTIDAAGLVDLFDGELDALKIL